MQGAVFTVMVVRVSDPDDPAFEEGLALQISRNPRFFENAPIVLDIKGVTGLNSADEFERLKAVLRRQNLVAAGIQNGTTSQRQGALGAGLGTFIASQPRSLRETLGHNGVVSDAPAVAPAAAQPAPAAMPEGGRGERSRLVTQPVRSGTQIYARGADLIITASVSPGAEVIADGNIHVYGSLRGRPSPAPPAIPKRAFSQTASRPSWSRWPAIISSANRSIEPCVTIPFKSRSSMTV